MVQDATDLTDCLPDGRHLNVGSWPARHLTTWPFRPFRLALDLPDLWRPHRLHQNATRLTFWPSRPDRLPTWRQAFGRWLLTYPPPDDLPDFIGASLTVSTCTTNRRAWAVRLNAQAEADLKECKEQGTDFVDSFGVYDVLLIRLLITDYRWWIVQNIL